MSERIRIHIGLPKTASTFIQDNISDRVDLKAQKIIYNEPTILKSLLSAIVLQDYDELTEKHEAHLQNLVNSVLNKYPQHRFVISEEMLSQRLLRFRQESRGLLLKRVFPTAKIVIVLRHQPTLWRSLINEHIKLGLDISHKDISFSANPSMNAWDAACKLIPAEWNYFKLITFWRDLFGSQFVPIFYENHTVNSLLTLVVNHLGIELDSQNYDKRVVNPSLKALAVQLRKIDSIYPRLSCKQDYLQSTHWAKLILDLGHETQIESQATQSNIAEARIKRKLRAVLSRFDYIGPDYRFPKQLERRLLDIANDLNEPLASLNNIAGTLPPQYVPDSS